MDNYSVVRCIATHMISPSKHTHIANILIDAYSNTADSIGL